MKARRVDEMSPRERLRAVVDRRLPDRVPVFPWARAFSIKSAGYLFGEVVQDPDKYIEAAVAMQRELRPDAIEDLFSSGLFAEAFGASIIIHDDDPPTVNASAQETALATPKDLERIPVDGEFLRHPRLQYAVGMIARLRKALDPDVPLLVNVPNPFLMAGSVRNIQAFMLDMLDAPEFVHALMETCLSNCVEYARMAIEAGGDTVLTMNPFASASCISRRHFLEFNHPYAARFFAGLRAAGIRAIFHVCGDWTDRLDLVVEEGPDVCYVDQADLGVLKGLYSGRVALMGNVRTVETMLRGTPAQVEAESRECIRKAAGGGGFILSADCVLPRDTPRANVAAMIEAARSHGHYPIAL